MLVVIKLAIASIAVWLEILMFLDVCAHLGCVFLCHTKGLLNMDAHIQAVAIFDGGCKYTRAQLDPACLINTVAHVQSLLAEVSPCAATYEIGK